MSVQGINNLFGRSLDGLITSSRGMSVVANNIANVNTEGYNRQQLLTGSRAVFGDGSNGGGVTVLGIRSLMNPFIERQLSNESTDLGTADGRRMTLSNIENILNDQNGSGLGSAIGSYFSSWSLLSQSADSGSLRQSVRESGVALANKFNGIANQLSTLRINLSDEIGSTVDRINSQVQEIANLNSSIQSATDDGTKQELRARIQVGIRKLSEDIGVNYFENGDETVTVQIAGSGFPLVFRSQASVLATDDDLSSGGDMAITANLYGSGTPVEVTSHITEGKLGGQLTDRNTTLNNQILQIDTLAYEFITQINAAHQAGYGLDSGTSRNFFAPVSGVTGAADLMEVDSGVMNNLDVIAAAGADPATSGRGNNTQALALVALQNDTTMSSGTKTFQGYFTDVMSSSGVSAGEIQRNFQNKSLVVSQLEQQRESVSGVNLDEEAADLLRYQRAFEGSAKIMAAANKLLDTLMAL